MNNGDTLLNSGRGGIENQVLCHHNSIDQIAVFLGWPDMS